MSPEFSSSVVENAPDGEIAIEATASGAVGLVGGNASESVVNAGSIVSSAPASVGIEVGSDSRLGHNTGSMTFSADDSVGIRGGERALIVNELGASLQMDGRSISERIRKNRWRPTKQEDARSFRSLVRAAFEVA